MPGDLEDFLKRAAERRAQKQQQGGGAKQRPASRPRPRPEYTDSRRERQIRQPIEDAIPVAEVVESVNPLAEQQRKVAEAKKRAEEARRKMAELQQSKRGQQGPSGGGEGNVSFSGDAPIEQLLQMLQHPGGIQQAFLLKEILDRPIDRW